MPARQTARAKGAKASRRKQPANVRYLMEMRWERNKRLRVEKEKRRQEENATKRYRVPRGSARRAARRYGTQRQRQPIAA